MATFEITLNGEPKSVTIEKYTSELFRDQPQIIALRINDQLSDLNAVIGSGDKVETIELSSADGLMILRHSTAHVLAQAVQKLFPQTRLGIGPPIKDGFYYDFEVERPFTPEDLLALEKEMAKIVKANQRFRRRVTNEKDALVELAA